MTAEAYYLLRKGEQVLGFQDLDDVALLRDILTRAGDPIARGTEGTIVGVHEDGSAYEVEFAEPDGAIATVEARDLRLVRSFAG